MGDPKINDKPPSPPPAPGDLPPAPNPDSGPPASIAPIDSFARTRRESLLSSLRGTVPASVAPVFSTSLTHGLFPDLDVVADDLLKTARSIETNPVPFVQNTLLPQLLNEGTVEVQMIVPMKSGNLGKGITVNGPNPTMVVDLQLQEGYPEGKITFYPPLVKNDVPIGAFGHYVNASTEIKQLQIESDPDQKKIRFNATVTGNISTKLTDWYLNTTAETAKILFGQPMETIPGPIGTFLDLLIQGAGAGNSPVDLVDMSKAVFRITTNRKEGDPSTPSLNKTSYLALRQKLLEISPALKIHNLYGLVEITPNAKTGGFTVTIPEAGFEKLEHHVIVVSGEEERNVVSMIPNVRLKDLSFDLAPTKDPNNLSANMFSALKTALPLLATLVAQRTTDWDALVRSTPLYLQSGRGNIEHGPISVGRDLDLPPEQGKQALQFVITDGKPPAMVNGWLTADMDVEVNAPAVGLEEAALNLRGDTMTLASLDLRSLSSQLATIGVPLGIGKMFIDLPNPPPTEVRLVKNIDGSHTFSVNSQVEGLSFKTPLGSFQMDGQLDWTTRMASTTVPFSGNFAGPSFRPVVGSNKLSLNGALYQEGWGPRLDGKINITDDLYGEVAIVSSATISGLGAMAANSEIDIDLSSQVRSISQEAGNLLSDDYSDDYYDFDRSIEQKVSFPRISTEININDQFKVTTEAQGEITRHEDGVVDYNGSIHDYGLETSLFDKIIRVKGHGGKLSIYIPSIESIQMQTTQPYDDLTLKIEGDLTPLPEGGVIDLDLTDWTQPWWTFRDSDATHPALSGIFVATASDAERNSVGAAEAQVFLSSSEAFVEGTVERGFTGGGVTIADGSRLRVSYNPQTNEMHLTTHLPSQQDPLVRLPDLAVAVQRAIEKLLPLGRGDVLIKLNGDIDQTFPVDKDLPSRLQEELKPLLDLQREIPKSPPPPTSDKSSSATPAP